MGIRVSTLIVMLGLAACAPIAEPETPPPVAPSKRAPQREPLPPAPSNMPEVIYASIYAPIHVSAVPGRTTQEPHVIATW